MFHASLLSVLFLAACASPSGDGSAPLPLEGQDNTPQSFDIAQLDPAGAAAAARRAHGAGDRRLYAVMGYALIFPAASRADAERLGYRIIAGTSDNFRSDEEHRFNDRAHAWAATWNREMLRLD